MNEKADTQDISPLFSQLVISFHAAAWQQMGKIANPLSGKVERNLELAKNSIDILGMLEEKTKGNLSDGELKLLQNALTELRMNYVDELKKPADTAKEKTPERESKPDKEDSGAKK